MATQYRLPFRLAIVLATATALSNCDSVDPGCYSYMELSVLVEVRDAATGSPAARGVTGKSEHESGVVTEFYARDDLYLDGNWQSELPGNHAVIFRKPGFLTDTVHADVDADRCHVVTDTVEARIAPDPRAVPEYPVAFVEGPDTVRWRTASAEVQVFGDTLEIKGFASSGDACTELRVGAFRSGGGLHVQVEPSDIPLDDCVSSRWFEARYTLPSEPTHLRVTNGFYVPAEFFDGQVRPAEEG